MDMTINELCEWIKEKNLGNTKVNVELIDDSDFCYSPADFGKTNINTNSTKESQNTLTLYIKM